MAMVSRMVQMFVVLAAFTASCAFEVDAKPVAKDAAAAVVEKVAEKAEPVKKDFNKIAPFGKEDTATELQNQASKTQDTLVDAVENAEVAEIKRAVFRALTRLRAASIKEFDTIARLETQSIDAYNDAHHYRGSLSILLLVAQSWQGWCGFIVLCLWH